MEEKQLLGEIKTLIEDYKEYANQEMPDLVNDFRANSLSEVQEKEYGTDREGEILKTLDEGKMYDKKRDDVITIPYQVRKELIEELVQIREAKKLEMRSTIFEKVGALINDSKEKVNQEIEEKRQELEEKKEEKRRNLEEKQQELEEKKQMIKDMKESSKAYDDEAKRIKGNKMLEAGYRFLRDKNKEINANIYDLSRDVNSLEKECANLKFEYEDFIIENDEGFQELVARLSEFDEIYDKMNSGNEEAIDYIEEMVANHIEDSEIHRLTEDEVEVIEPQELKELKRKEEEQKLWELYDNETRKQQEEWEKQKEEEWEKHDKKGENINETIILKQQLRKRLDEIEEGNKDFIVPSYFKFRDKVNEEKDIKNVLKILEGKKLLDIYEGLLVYMVDSPAKKEVEDVINKLKTRETEEKPEGTKPEGTKPKGTKPEGTKPKGTQPKATVKNYRVIDSNGREIDAIETIRAMQERQILEEELEQRLQEIKAGNEDLVNDSYLLLEQDLRNREDIENVIESLEGKTIKDIYEGMLEQAKTLEEKEELEGIISELDAREAQLINQEQAQEQEHEQILTEIEQKIIEWETGNEDLLLPIYFDYIDFYIEKSSEDYDYAKQMLEYFEGTNLSGFYKDILDAISKEEEPSEKDITDIEDIKNIVAKLAERDKHRIKSTTIVVEPYKDLIKINIKGREKTICLKNILGLIDKGKGLQEGELISKFGVNRCHPAILAVLTELGEKYPAYKDLIDEYINTFSDGKTDKIDDIIYYFNEGEKNKADNYKKIVSACKKYAKADAKYGMATIEETGKKGIIGRLKGLGIQIEKFFNNQKQKRLESKEAKEYRTSRLKRFKGKNEDIEEPAKKKNPREAFMEKIRSKGKSKNQTGEMDMSEAIEKLQAINQEMDDQPVVKEEEEVL